VVRCNSNGSLDSTFGSGGVVTLPFAAKALAVRGDNKIVVAGGTAADDNVLLAHADRTRFVEDDLRRMVSQEGLVVGSVLVDGVAGATWTTARERGASVLRIRPLVELTAAQKDEVADEGTRFLQFLAPATDHRSLEFVGNA